jgi:hypothetical protein
MQRRIRDIDFGDWIGNPQTRSAAGKCAGQIFQRILSESLKEVSTGAIATGLFESGARRGRGITKDSSAPKRSGNEAFLWLAGCQTRAWSRERIANAVGVERNTVGIAVAKLAADLKIKPRPNGSYDKNGTIEVIRRDLEAARVEERAYESFLKE